MRSRPEATVRDAFPICAVVDGPESGFCPVRDFVMLISGFGQQLAEQFILLTALLVRGFFIASAADHRGQCAVFVDGQLIRGDVFGIQGNGLAYALFPAREFELRQTENQVDADVAETGFAQQAEGPVRACGIVAAIHPAQYSIVEGLDADTDARHSSVAQPLQVLPSIAIDVIGIDLECKFFIIRPSQSPHYTFQLLGRQY